MSTLLELIPDGWLPYLIGGGVVATTIIALLIRRYRTINEKDFLVDAPKDTVVLRQLPRGPYAPNVSPYPIKLETYLRMAKIPYQNVFGMTMSPKTNKTPWAQFNGEILTDSQFIIDHLNKHFNIDTMSHLTPIEKATARAYLRMWEEGTYWCGVKWRFEFDSDEFMTVKCKVPSLVFKMIRRTMQKQCHAQGTGRLLPEQVWHIFKADAEALSVYLGDKKFLTGDKPCEVDCGIFGLLAGIKWQMPNSPMLDTMNDYPNLHAYCERMKETFWPDWEDCTTHGGTKEALK